MDIQNIILHEVRKDTTDKLAHVHTRPDENPADEKAHQLTKELSNLFQTSGLNSGGFDTKDDVDHPTPHFVKLLTHYFDSKSFSDYVAFTIAATQHFGRVLSKGSSSGAKGGYLLFNHYIHTSEHFLSIVLLRKKTGLTLSSGLSLNTIEQIDLDRLHLAARINLTAWQNGTSKRYISFKSGKTAKEVTDYFSDFIGCKIYTQAKEDTANLLNATKVFCTQHALSQDNTERARELVHDHCLNRLNNEEVITLDDISDLLDITFKSSIKTPKTFLTTAQSEPYCLSNEIVIERRALKRFVRISGGNSRMRISFDLDLLNETVFYNEKEKELRFTEIPTNLKTELEKQEL